MTARFVSPLDVELLPNGRWKLLQDLVYQGSHGTIRVPRGFDTDFASVPRVPVLFWLTGDTARMAAVVHDWLYRTQTVSRAAADFVLWEASGASAEPQPAWRRRLLWLGVRLGGWLAWSQNRRSASQWRT